MPVYELAVVMLVCRMSEGQAPRRSSRVASKRVVDAVLAEVPIPAAASLAVASPLPRKRGRHDADAAVLTGECTGCGRLRVRVCAIVLFRMTTLRPAFARVHSQVHHSLKTLYHLLPPSHHCHLVYPLSKLLH